MTLRIRSSFLLVLLLALLSAGCAQPLKKIVLNKAFGPPGDTPEPSFLETEEDPELVRESLPLMIKLLESVHEGFPQNPYLGLSTAQGFLLYATAFVEPDAVRAEFEDYRTHKRLMYRAHRYYVRAKEICLRSLEVQYPDFVATVTDAEKVGGLVDSVAVEHHDLLYYLAGAWALAIASNIDNAELLAQLSIPEGIIANLQRKDPAYGNGAIEEFFFSLTLAKSSSESAQEEAKALFAAAELKSEGTNLDLKIKYATKISVQNQDRAEFEEILQSVLEFDLSKAPGRLMLNTLAKQHAEWLLDNIDEFFI